MTTMRWLMLAIPLLALLAAGPAGAGLLSESAHSNLSYSVIDLTPA
jgi:hypothetical protein